jgi:hypothetical protein
MSADLGAQEALLPSTGWGFGPSLSAWHFATAIPQSSGAVANIIEVSVPFRVRSVFGRWSVDLSGAAAYGAVHLTSNPATRDQSGQGEGGEDSGDRLVSIGGPTDLKLRLTGPIIGGSWLVTAGFNIPSGKSALNGDETSALQAIGAPGLHMPVASFGTGAGATLGVIRAFQGDNWAVALGASAEQRTEYSPIALVLSAGRSETKVTPGTALHVTAGLDRPLGENRMSVLLVGDVFSKDRIQIGETAHDGTNDYQLGPQLTASGRIDLAASRWRDASVSVAARMRSEFSDATGAKVSGSSGTYLEGAIGGVRGGAEGAGFIIGTDFRFHSGLKFTDALVGAAVTAAGVTIGVEKVGGSTMTRFYLHGQYGSFDTGTANTTGMGITLGLTVSGRREAR